PTELRARAEHHLRWAIEQTYRTIEPARLRALAEMHRLALSATTDTEIRETINAYLGEGMLPGRLHTLIDGADELDVAQLIVELDVTYSPLEWAGAAARQLEATPGHPAALCAAAMGEMLRSHPDLDRFSQFCRQALEGLPAFGASDAEQLTLFRFLLDRTRQNSRVLMGAVWRAAPASLDDAPDLLRLEDTILRRAQSGGFDLPELAQVLARRLRRSVALADRLLQQETT
ncbi:MAG: hypothetical protein O3C27_16925, partial [Actinomycetota bacterium]|nr:hypothetical protein [Actinomycetota bacterium]